MESANPALILVCGLPGAGKSTLAKQLEAQHQALRLEPDAWLADLGCDLFDEEARDRVERLQWQLSQRVLRLGQSVILESGFWSRQERDEKRLAARGLGVRVRLHYLDVSLDEVVQRVTSRQASDATAPTITREMLEKWSQVFEAPTGDELQLFDQL